MTRLRILLIALWGLMGLTGAAAAQTALEMSVGEGRDLSMPPGASSVLVADPGIADAQATSAQSIFVTAIAPGRTTIIVRDADARPMRQFNVRVHRGTNGAERSLGRNITLTETDDGAILSGSAADVTEAQSIAGANSVLNEQGLLVQDRTVFDGPNQVSLRVRFVEASRTELRRLGLDIDGFNGAVSGPIRMTTGGNVGAVLGGLGTSSPAVAGRLSSDGMNVDAMLQALEQRGVVQILSEPTLTTVNGRTASFRAGGEFGYPVNQGDGVISTEFKPYGVSLEFTPTILPNNRIAIDVTPEVSFLDRALGNGPPSVSVRRAQTTVELASGQTFAIAGLYEQRSSQSAEGVPGLSQILGTNTRQRDERELMIFITPYLAEPSDAVETRPQRPAPRSTVGFITR